MDDLDRKIAWETLETNQIFCEVRLCKSGSGSEKGRGKEQTLGSFKVDGLLFLRRSSTNSDDATTSKNHKKTVHPSIVLEFLGAIIMDVRHAIPTGLR